MNYHKIISSLGTILIIVGLAKVFPLGWSLYFNEEVWRIFLTSGIITACVGFLAYRGAKLEGDFHNREAFVLVTFSWIFASLFGAIPFYFSGYFSSFTDAFFESISGFTTTGASVIISIESLPYGLIFWRTLTHWLGGMGIVVLFVALLSSLGAGGIQMFRAEIPGHTTQKLKPRISETAKLLWYTYLIFTMAQTVILWLLGMTLFDAMCHALGTVATAGASTKNAGIGYYTDPLIHWVIIFFMLLSGANFALYYQALRGRSMLTFWRNSEFRMYVSIILLSCFLVLSNLHLSGSLGNGTTITQAVFKVVAMTTTTGFIIADIDKWPYFSQALLVALMFVGGCAGSTGGSIKVGRILVLLKQSLLELQQAVHPRAIMSIKIGEKSVSHLAVITILQFFFLFILIVILGTVFMTSLGLDLVSAFTAVTASLTNTGVGLAQVGPTSNFGVIPVAGKLFLAGLMLLGRLELFTVLVLFLPSFWRR